MPEVPPSNEVCDFVIFAGACGWPGAKANPHPSCPAAKRKHGLEIAPTAAVLDTASPSSPPSGDWFD